MNYKGILFDLDGTLLDTARDLGNALNNVLKDANLPPLSYQQYQYAASDGAMKLLELGFGEQWREQDQGQRRQQFLAHYEQHIANDTKLYPGVEALIQVLQKHHIPWGIVTNKPEYLTNQLLPHYPALDGAQCVISGDSLLRKKPDPAPLNFAAGILNIMPHQVIYLGDALRDIQAANQADMLSVIALYGYIPKDQQTTEWKADKQVISPLELVSFLSLKQGS